MIWYNGINQGINTLPFCNSALLNSQRTAKIYVATPLKNYLKHIYIYYQTFLDFYILEVKSTLYICRVYKCIVSRSRQLRKGVSIMPNEFKDRWKVDFKMEDFKAIVNAEPIPDAMSEYVTQSVRTLSEHIAKEETKLILENLDFNSLEALYFQIKDEFYNRTKEYQSCNQRK